MSKTNVTTIAGLIEALGGNRILAAHLGTNENAISMWLVREYIPPGWHLKLFLECARRGVAIDPCLFELPDDAFDLPVPPLRGHRSKARRAA